MKINTLVPRLTGLVMAMFVFAASADAQIRIASISQGQTPDRSGEVIVGQNGSVFEVGTDNGNSNSTNPTFEGGSDSPVDFYVDHNMDFSTNILTINVMGASPRFVLGVTMSNAGGSQLPVETQRVGNTFTIGIENFRPERYTVYVHTLDRTERFSIDLR